MDNANNEVHSFGANQAATTQLQEFGKKDTHVDTASPVLSSHVAAASTLSIASADSSIMPSDSKSMAPSTGPASTVEELDDALKEALANAEARPFVIDLARQIEDFLRNDTKGRLQVTTQTSYQRMLLHRCANFFNLLVESESPRVASLYRSSTSFLPKVRLEELFLSPEENTKPNYQLLKRQHPSQKPRRASSEIDGRSDAGGSTHSSTSRKAHSQSIQEREAAYKAARSRIFEGFDDSVETVSVASTSVTSRRSDVDDEEYFRRYPVQAAPYGQVMMGQYGYGRGAPGLPPYPQMPYFAYAQPVYPQPNTYPPYAETCMPNAPYVPAYVPFPPYAMAWQPAPGFHQVNNAANSVPDVQQPKTTHVSNEREWPTFPNTETSAVDQSDPTQTGTAEQRKAHSHPETKPLATVHPISPAQTQSRQTNTDTSAPADAKLNPTEPKQAVNWAGIVAGKARPQTPRTQTS